MKLRYKLTIPITVAGLMLGGAAASASPAGTGRQPVVVEDVLIPVAGQPAVRAFVVHPQRVTRPRSLAGVLYLHWFEPPGSNQDRGEFLAEAVAIAASGAVAVLPQLTFPWQGDPVGDARDRAAVEAQLAAVVRAYDYLLAQRGVDPRRTAVVGHDYGAMYGAILAQRRATVATAVLMAPDATWANWFDTYWLGLPDEQKPAYRALFAGLDPVDNVSRLGGALYLQFAGRDPFVPPETRAAFAAANPAAKVSLYERSDHFLQQPAEDDRAAWLASHL
jgi:dienelactone hydrolase